MVIYRTPDGTPGYQQADSISEAVNQVERLRNEDGVDQARIFQMEEVAFEFRPYFRVEIAGPAAESEPAPVEPAPVADEVPAPSWMSPPPAEPAAPVEPVRDHVEPVDHVDDPLGPSDDPFGGHHDVPPPPPPPGGEFDDEPLGAGSPRRGLLGR